MPGTWNFRAQSCNISPEAEGAICNCITPAAMGFPFCQSWSLVLDFRILYENRNHFVTNCTVEENLSNLNIMTPLSDLTIYSFRILIRERTKVVMCVNLSCATAINRFIFHDPMRA
jgi:hypothetical protein